MLNTGQVKADAEARLLYQHSGDGLAYIQRYQDEAIIEVCEEVERLTSLLELAEFGANSPHKTWNKE